MYANVPINRTSGVCSRGSNALFECFDVSDVFASIYFWDMAITTAITTAILFCPIIAIRRHCHEELQTYITSSRYRKPFWEWDISEQRKRTRVLTLQPEWSSHFN